MMNNTLIGFALGVVTSLAFVAFILLFNSFGKLNNRESKIEFEDEPLAINENNPPRWMNYSPSSLSHKAYCACHGERLVPGQKVLLWPATEKSSPLFFCQEGVAEVVAQ